MWLLVVEDEAKTAAFLRKGLEENGFVVDLARRGGDGLHMARTVHYDTLILDVMTPASAGGRWSPAPAGPARCGSLDLGYSRRTPRLSARP